MNVVVRHFRQWRYLDVHAFFCGRGKVGGDNNSLLHVESIESCLTEQRCSVDLPCVTFCFVLLLVRPLGC